MRYAPSGPEVIMQDFGDETVVANLESGLFYSLSGAAIPLWGWIVEGRATDTLPQCFIASAEMPVQTIATAVEAFVGSLLAEGLIEPVSGGPDGLPIASPVAFTAPTIERFDDLQGLLLVDPIHDVGPQGWPLRPNEEA